MANANLIRTPDQRVRVFVSSALQELAAERQAVQEAIAGLRLVPVMFELGARPHRPQNVYRAYLDQSQIFVGIYWQTYGWVAPGEQISGLEDEYLLSAGLPRLIYVKSPAPERDPRLAEMLGRIRDDGDLSYQHFSDPAGLRKLVADDLAVLLSERFATAQAGDRETAPDEPAEALPSAVTPLVGRKRDAEAARNLVLREGVRLVTFTGPGGVGKSRLALEVASLLSPQFKTGVRLVDLAPVQEADLVTNTIATALGLRTSGGSLIADVKAYLRGRRLVLVLDNFEQVTAAAPVVAELLAAAPGLVVLTTSRAPLRLNGEHEFAVAPLPTPPADITRTGDLRRYASVRLFLERAHAAVPGFRLTRANAAVVAEICRRLDGLPLAIELAAARVGLLQPQALLARLDNRLDLLTGGARDLPARQQTLRSTLDWSFSLLSPAEQALFRRLSVFSASFDLEAAEAIGGSYGSGPADRKRPGEVIDTFGSLVHASLIRAVDRDGQLRFSLLETIREYALERLRESGEWNEAHDRHAAHFLALAESAGDGLEGPDQVPWLDRLETEHGSLGAAMRWFLDQGQPGLTDRMGALTWRFWWFRGHTEEFARYAEMTIAMANQMPRNEGGWAHIGLGFMLIASGDQARARALFEQGRALFSRVGDRNGIAITSAALGHLAALRHEYAQAEELLKKSLALARDLGVTEYVGAIYNFLGQIPFAQGDTHAAARLFTQGLNAARHGPDRMPLLISLYDLALTRQASEDLDGAARLLREGLSVASDIGDDSSVGYYLQRLATLARKPERAVCLVAAADALLQATGTGWLRAYVAANSSGDDGLSALRQRMGEAKFQQAWARGAAMGRRGAVAYALRADDPATQR